MRFNTFIETFFVKRMHSKLAETRWVVRSVGGNWETWAQIETALATDGKAHLSFEREVQYPESSKRCDFLVIPDNAPDARIWIELKVQLRSGLVDLVRRFAADVKKMNEIYKQHKGAFKSSSGGPVSFAVGGAREYLVNLRESMPDLKGRCAVFDEQSSVVRYDLQDVDPSKIKNTSAIVVYCELLGKK